ncbi:two-component system chemotaxis response regulator CheB [Bacillus oleivorans]|uniref:Protein-glutamate methylesterase/protein-glutamine glutaminase n=1 Tax=Bacillus oleivorans TaxID=1448271 RepID=A0A285D1M9_9BACI|nr:chemotaxis response regulator protein-glutamate methylesterase [Bacillus oleivorans]SNX73702.1 two-component system chemotaxis response regulator CheB [Bacillus oleivorans]
MMKVRVLIVDDSAFMRKVITDFLSDHPQIEVVGTARNGEDALKKIQQLKPDCLTLDVEMPVLNGLDALEMIMEQNPIPVVMLSSSTREGATSTLQALQLGAVDFVAKPSGPISLDMHKIKDELVEKVLHASTVNIQRIVGTKKSSKGMAKKDSRPNYESLRKEKAPSAGDPKLVLIGTSTGGPKALQTVLTQIPTTIDVPIVVVQHMPPKFTESLSLRLDSLCSLRVKEAECFEKLENGVVYIAPGGVHLEIKKSGSSLIFEMNDKDPVHGVRPSVDLLFQSAAALEEYEKIAVIMTGMGSDGTKGLELLKQQGQTIAIAESEQTCMVYGMPKSAVSAGLVDIIVNVEDIPGAILSLL